MSLILHTAAKAVLRSGLILGLIALGTACVTTSENEDPRGQRTHYTLRMGETMRYPQPLPSRSTILVDWHYENGSSESFEGFRAWDVDGDGRFEMVEVMTDDGHVQSRVYDFDGDGRSDRIENLP